MLPMTDVPSYPRTMSNRMFGASPQQVNLKSASSLSNLSLAFNPQHQHPNYLPTSISYQHKMVGLRKNFNMPQLKDEDEKKETEESRMSTKV